MKRHLGLAGLAIVTALVGADQPVRAQVGDLDWSLARLADRYGVGVIRRREGNAEVVELQPGGVLIRRTIRLPYWDSDGNDRSGGSPPDLVEDRSGHGAVLCTWIIYTQLRGGLDVCAPGKFPGLRERLDGAIAAMNAFIAANNGVPMTVEQVEAEAAFQDEWGRVRASAASTSPWCRSGDLEQWAASFSLMPRDEWERSVADLLSVPRPPVLDPCPSMPAFQGLPWLDGARPQRPAAP